MSPALLLKYSHAVLMVSSTTLHSTPWPFALASLPRVHNERATQSCYPNSIGNLTCPKQTLLSLKPATFLLESTDKRIITSFLPLDLWMCSQGAVVGAHRLCPFHIRFLELCKKGLQLHVNAAINLWGSEHVQTELRAWRRTALAEGAERTPVPWSDVCSLIIGVCPDFHIRKTL